MLYFIFWNPQCAFPPPESYVLPRFPLSPPQIAFWLVYFHFAAFTPHLAPGSQLQFHFDSRSTGSMIYVLGMRRLLLYFWAESDL